MSISARTRQSTWSTDAPGASTGSGAQFCEGAGSPPLGLLLFPGRGSQFCAPRHSPRGRGAPPHLQSPPNLRRPHPRRPKIPQRRVQIPSMRRGRSKPLPQYPRRSLLRLAQTSRALSFKLHANPVLGSKSLPASDFKLSSRKFGRSVSRSRGSAFAREARFEPPLSKGGALGRGLSAPSWRPRAALSLA